MSPAEAVSAFNRIVQRVAREENFSSTVHTLTHDDLDGSSTLDFRQSARDAGIHNLLQLQLEFSALKSKYAAFMFQYQHKGVDKYVIVPHHAAPAAFQAQLNAPGMQVAKAGVVLDPAQVAVMSPDGAALFRQWAVLEVRQELERQKAERADAGKPSEQGSRAHQEDTPQPPLAIDPTLMVQAAVRKGRDRAEERQAVERENERRAQERRDADEERTRAMDNKQRILNKHIEHSRLQQEAIATPGAS